MFARGIVHMPATCLEAAEKVCMTACAQVKVRAQSQHDEVLEGRGGLGIHHAAAAPGGSGSLGCTRAAHSCSCAVAATLEVAFGAMGRQARRACCHIVTIGGDQFFLL